MSRAAATLVEALAARAGDARPRLFFPQEEGASLSYADLWRCSGACAAALAALGARRGTRVGVVMANSSETVVVVVALMRLGCVLVPIVHRPIVDTRKREARLITRALDVSGATLCVAPAAVAASIDGLVRSAGLAVETVTASSLADGASVLRDTAVAAGSDLMMIQFSSGSTGDPKPVPLTVDNVVSNVAGIAERIRGREDDTLYSWLPLHHDMGLVGGLFTTLHVGGGIVLSTPLAFIRNPLGWIAGMSEHRATVSIAPQFAFRLCLAKSEFAWPSIAGCDLAALRLIMNGAEHVNGRVCTAFEERFAHIGLRRHSIQPTYGLAENAAAVSLREPGTPVPVRCFSRDGFAPVPRPETPSADVVELAGHGCPIAGTEIRIGHGGDPSDPAEIYIRGESTALAAGDWLATGDIGVISDGELYIVGRSKEIIKHGGRAFALSHIEHSLALLAPEQVGAVAVVASEIGQEREETLTVLVEDPRDMDRQSFADRVRRTLLREFGLVAEDVVFVRRGGIPRTTNGKLRRSALRGVLHAQRAGSVDQLLEST